MSLYEEGYSSRVLRYMLQLPAYTHGYNDSTVRFSIARNPAYTLTYCRDRKSLSNDMFRIPLRYSDLSTYEIYEVYKNQKHFYKIGKELWS